MPAHEYTEIDLRPFRNGPTRSAVRKRLMLHFANEEPGRGNKTEVSRYKYLVETFADGSNMYLLRPGRRNPLDVRIQLDGYRFGNRLDVPRPTHVYEDLLVKKTHNERYYKKLLGFIDALHKAEEFKDKQLETIRKKFDGVGYPIDVLLAIVKWLFIEQDLLHWNFAGRNSEFYANIPR